MNIRFSNFSYLKSLLLFFKTFQNSLKKIYSSSNPRSPSELFSHFLPPSLMQLSFEIGEGSISLGCLLGFCHPTLMWHGGSHLSRRHLALVTAKAFLMLLWFLGALSEAPNAETKPGESHDIPILPIQFS